MNKVKSKSICLFDCNGREFELKATYPISICEPQGMCYVETERHGGILVLTSYFEHVIQAAVLETQKIIWKQEGEIGGTLCQPDGITTDGSSRLFIADNGNHRILVLKADTGCVLQTILVPDLEGMAGLAWCTIMPHLAVRHKGSDLKCKITYLNV